jgi:hypothetical protein
MLLVTIDTSLHAERFDDGSRLLVSIAVTRDACKLCRRMLSMAEINEIRQLGRRPGVSAVRHRDMTSLATGNVWQTGADFCICARVTGSALQF